MSLPIPKDLSMQTLSFCKIKNYCCVLNSLVVHGLTGGDPNICMQMDPWLNVSATIILEM